jgi:hypothetical protein
MRFEAFSFGSIRIDGVTYTHDVVIDRGRVRKAQEEAIQEVPRCLWAHTAINGGGDTLEMPAACDRYRHRRLPVMDEVKHEARRRHIKLVILPTAEAIAELKKRPEHVNAILHVTC